MVINKKLFTEEYFVKNIQKRIRFRREELNLTQEDVAEKLNIPLSTYSYYETKADKLLPHFVENVSDVLETEIQKLLFSPFARTGDAIMENALLVTKSEKKLLITYRILPLEKRKKVRDYLNKFYQEMKNEFMSKK